MENGLNYLPGSKEDQQRVVDMLLLCGELGGKRKDETFTAYLRRILDAATPVEVRRPDAY